MNISSVNSYGPVQYKPTVQSVSTARNNTDKVESIKPVSVEVNNTPQTEVLTYSFNKATGSVETTSLNETPQSKAQSEDKVESDFEKKMKEEKLKEDYEKLEKLIFPPVTFGFNNDSRDFYVRVDRGNFVTEFTQYPTEAMIKMKIYQKHLLDTYV